MVLVVKVVCGNLV
ncbi:hypothetical protein M2G34_22370 [Vibrio vulnificus]|nr:hypothetical protein [Vibrio vulnificus]MCU8492652.1 hypothetical protein [Vibrio vulnificus]